jgi:RNA recognition motif-containing protein
VIVDKKSGKSLGYGFIGFEERKDAKNAFQILNNMECNGRRLRLEWSFGIGKRKPKKFFGKIEGGFEGSHDNYFEHETHTAYNENRKHTIGFKRSRCPTQCSNSPMKKHKSASVACLNRVKTLYNEGREEDAFQEYFLNPNPFAATFL